MLSPILTTRPMLYLLKHQPNEMEQRILKLEYRLKDIEERLPTPQKLTQQQMNIINDNIKKTYKLSWSEVCYHAHNSKINPLSISSLPNQPCNMNQKFIFHMDSDLAFGYERQSRQVINKLRVYSTIPWIWGNIITFKNVRTDNGYARSYDRNGSTYKTISKAHFYWYMSRCAHVYIK